MSRPINKQRSHTIPIENKRSLFSEFADNPVFRTLEASQSIGVSVLQGDIENALKILSPIHSGERRLPTDLTGHTGVGGFVENVIFDPINFAFGTGAVSKFGQATKTVERLTIAAEQAKKMGMGADVIADIEKGLKAAKQTLSTLKPGAKRNLLTVGVPFSKTLQHEVPLPEVVRIAGEKIAESRYAGKVLESGKKITNLVSNRFRTVETQEGLKLKRMKEARLNVDVDKILLKSIEDVKVFGDPKLPETHIKAVNALEALGTKLKANEKLVQLNEKVSGLEQTIEARFQRAWLSREAKERVKFEKMYGPNPDIDALNRQLDFAKTSLRAKYSLEIDKIKESIIKVEAKKQQATGIIDALSEPERNFLEGFAKLNNNILLKEQALGRNIQELGTKSLLGYAKRSLTKEALQYRKKHRQVVNGILNQASITRGSSAVRTIFREEGITQANKLIRTQTAALAKERGDPSLIFKGDFFDTNIIKSMENRLREHTRFVANASFIHSMVNTFGTDVGGIYAPKLIKELGLPGAQAQYRGLFIGEDIAKEIKQVTKVIKFEPLVTTLTRASSFVNKWTASLVTVPFPDYHNRNILGNMFNMMLSGMGPVAIFRYMKKAAALQKRIIDKTATSADLVLLDDLLSGRIIRTGLHKDILDNFADISKTGKFTSVGDLIKNAIANPTKTAARMKLYFSGTAERGPLLSTLKYVPSGHEAGILIEDNAKIAKYLYEIEKGTSKYEAIQTVNKYLFDYGDLTPVEQIVGKHGFLFYTWLRKNLPLQIEYLFKQPAIAATYNKLTDHDRDAPLPNYLLPQAVIPLSPGRALGTSFLPISDLVRHFSTADAPPSASAQIGRMGQNIISSMAPIPKTAFELIANKNVFTGQEYTNVNFINRILKILPTSRFITTGEKFLDGELSWWEKILNIFTGVKQITYDEDQALMDQMTRRIEQHGKTARIEILVPKRTKNRRTGEYEKDPQGEELLKLRNKLYKELKRG